jgi:hypothetical protein
LARARARRTRTAVAALAAIRFGLAGAGLGAAIAAGASRNAGVLGFALGAVGGAVFVLNDPRRRFLKATPPPGDEPWWRTALRWTYPSTLGLAALTGIALAFSPVLAAVLAGIIAGLGIAGLTAALRFRA